MKKIFNGNLGLKDLNKKVTLYGWIENVRKMGKICFINLRDRWGIVQLIAPGKYSTIPKESVVQASGKVVRRRSENKKLKTGKIEVQVSKILVLNSADTLPFEINSPIVANEDLRLENRYLDIRNRKLTNNLIVRHKLIKAFRDFLDKENFLEVETPILSKSTPEGARDFLVITRKKSFYYALPQSPQLYKQLLMVAGIERYFQISKVFRDEDARSDRQPEFTQLDIELSFASENDVIRLVERLLKYAFKQIGISIKTPFNKINYEDAIKKYKTDKPVINKNNLFDFNWVINWPLFEINNGKKEIMHHPFTMPKIESVKDFQENPNPLSKGYDLVLNGSEIAGGSVRIHKKDIQVEVLRLLGISNKEIKDKFGFFLKSFDFGMPPHAGIAIGIDRLLAIIQNEKSIKEVIAFPKNSKCIASLEKAPAYISDTDLKKHLK